MDSKKLSIATKTMLAEMKRVEAALARSVDPQGAARTGAFVAGVRAGSPGAAALTPILDEFRIYEKQVSHYSDPGESRARTEWTPRDPELLNPAQVKTIFAALADATRALRRLDTGGDGRVSPAEAAIGRPDLGQSSSGTGSDLPGRIAEAVLDRAIEKSVEGAPLGQRLQLEMERAAETLAALSRRAETRGEKVQHSELARALRGLAPGGWSRRIIELAMVSNQRDLPSLPKSYVQSLERAFREAKEAVAARTGSDGKLSREDLGALMARVHELSSSSFLTGEVLGLFVAPHAPKETPLEILMEHMPGVPWR